MPELVVIRRLNYRHEAEVIRSVLEASGIEALVTSDDCGSVDPALSLVWGANICVNADDVERAEDILAADAVAAAAAADEQADAPDA